MIGFTDFIIIMNAHQRLTHDLNEVEVVRVITLLEKSRSQSFVAKSYEQISSALIRAPFSEWQLTKERQDSPIQ